MKKSFFRLIAFTVFFSCILSACNNSSTTTTEADTAATMQAPAMDTSMQMMQDTGMMDTSKMDTASTRPVRHPN